VPGTAVALFRSPRLAVAGNTGTSNFLARPPYAVTASGRFLLDVSTGDEGAAPITGVLNWAAGLQQESPLLPTSPDQAIGKEQSRRVERSRPGKSVARSAFSITAAERSRRTVLPTGCNEGQPAVPVPPSRLSDARPLQPGR